MMRTILLLAALILLTFNTQAQNYEDVMGSEPTIHGGNFTLSLGYGTPSILRTFLRRETNEDDLSIKGFGPASVKAEFMIFNNLGIGVNAYYNTSNVSWQADGQDSLGNWSKYLYGVEVNELALNLRINYHFYRKNNWDLYAGVGGGYGFINAETYNEAPIPSFYANYRFPDPISAECTFGARYFPIKHLGLTAEAGIGRSWILYERYFIPEALIQFGIVFKI